MSLKATFWKRYEDEKPNVPPQKALHMWYSHMGDHYDYWHTLEDIQRKWRRK